MTMHSALPGAIPEDLDSLLAAAYAVEMPTDLGAMVDRRVKRAVRQWRPQTSAGWRPARPRWWRLALVPVLVAVLTVAVLVTTSASGGPAAFYGTDGGYMWDHAEVLGLTKTVDGYRITLERAYADANQMMLAVTVVDTQNRGWRQVDVGSLSVADSAGGDWTLATGISDPVNVTSAATISWFEHTPGPAGPGRRPFSVTVSSVRVRNQEVGPLPSDLTWDPWHPVVMYATFSFELTVGGGSQATPHVSSALTVGGGSQATPQVSSESNGVTITLERIVTSPSTVRLDLRMAGTPSSGTSGTNWTPIVLSVSHAGHNLDVEMQTSQIGGSLTTVYTSEGVEDPTGAWTVTISQLMGDGPGAGNQGQDVRDDGNWTLQFTMP